MFCEIREIVENDRAWLRAFLTKHWGSPQMVYSTGVYDCDQLPGFAAFEGGDVVGVVTVAVHEDACEIVSLDALPAGQGIGTALLRAVEHWAQEQGLSRCWLLTTNDNLRALGFYQKRGYALVELLPNAVETARKIKPQIPLIAENGIPIRDEVRLEKTL
jgi:GNAT superfamily N-acetyltransferase